LEKDDDVIFLEGGTPYDEVMDVLGVPPPAVPHAAPASAAPAASLARALPLSVVTGDPLRSKPKKVVIKLLMGFF
jgi:hypothetical protein